MTWKKCEIFYQACLVCQWLNNFKLIANLLKVLKHPVLPNMHCALRASAAIFLLLKNLCQSLNVAFSHLFKYLIYLGTLKM